jgi:UDP-glucuronate 4-epimerase
MISNSGMRRQTLTISETASPANFSMSSKPEKILITGGAGFIASHLCEALLAEGADLVVIDDFNDFYDPALKEENIAGFRDKISLVRGDIRDAAMLESLFVEHQFDKVFHFAARAGVRPSITDPKLYFTTNIDGTFNLLDACRHHGVTRFVFASSSSVYGINRKVPFAESDPIERTISPYAATKIAGEQICSNYSHLFGIHCSCLRFFTVYGPRQRPDLAIAKFTRAIREGRPIDRYGDGSTARDYTYVEDIVQGVLAAARHMEVSPFEIFNLGGSATTTLSEMIALLEGVLGRKAVIRPLPDQPGDVPKTYADVDKARRLLGYEPRTPVALGLQKYADWLASRSS